MHLTLNQLGTVLGRLSQQLLGTKAKPNMINIQDLYLYYSGWVNRERIFIDSLKPGLPNLIVTHPSKLAMQ